MVNHVPARDDSASSLREKKKRETRTALARAAAELLLNEGDDGMTVAAIAEQAGVSTRTFHNYFSRREDALLSFLDDTFIDWQEQVDQAPADEHPLDTMHRLIAGRVNGVDASRDPGTLLNLKSIGDHLHYLTGPEDKQRILHMADGLLDALYERAQGSMSRQGTALLLVTSIAAGGIAVENMQQDDAAEDNCLMWTSLSGRKPSEILDESFELLRTGFGG
jgi:AcrR family transcriptional regulator